MRVTQNDKIMQMKIDTMIVGIDVGKETHYAKAIDIRGVELGRLLRFSNDAEGYASLDKWMNEIMKRTEKTEAIVGFEPTGHYWFTLADHLKGRGHKLAIVNPYHVKCTKELDDNSPTKNDLKDPKTIAMLVKDGRYRDVYIPKELYQELREAVWEYERLKRRKKDIKNQVTRWLDIRFPEFEKVFSAWDGKAARIILKKCPTPARVVEAGTEGIMNIWLEQGVKGASRKKANGIVEAAQKSIGRTIGLVAAEKSLRNMLTEYEMIEKQLEEQEKQMGELLRQVPNTEYLLGMKGMGMVSTAIIVSEIGDIRRFQAARQIIKMSGLNLSENSSGKHKGQTKISKRGRKRLRTALFRIVIPLIANNEEFRMLHHRYVSREKNPLKKMQSIIALCCKLIRIIYAILTKGIEYDRNEVLRGIKPRVKAA